ncbi:hypothetical protein J2I47_02875 [Fibrella sp. HMF5335]|uniref:Heavy-metal-binding n=1 Tax=Fibrella rubiginis TaxID=2817060 RepID=A0A939K3B9_9BACT|nr:hypothetical protein [Fibrella rubiginis]MBO0935483.1 hypothetical protein [Fibrella rubiginis]
MTKNKCSVLIGIILLLSQTACFRPVIPISTGPKYPIDIFYADQQPGRPYDDIKLLYISEEVPIQTKQKVRGGRMLSRGNSMLEKDAMLAKLTVQAQRLGATALVNVTYQYYTTATTNGYSMEGLAVKYRSEQEATRQEN